MKTDNKSYIIVQINRNTGDKYLLHKRYEDDVLKEYVEELVYECNSKAELDIYLNLVGLDWDKDFKLIEINSGIGYSYKTYKTDCME